MKHKRSPVAWSALLLALLLAAAATACGDDDPFSSSGPCGGFMNDIQADRGIPDSVATTSVVTNGVPQDITEWFYFEEEVRIDFVVENGQCAFVENPLTS